MQCPTNVVRTDSFKGFEMHWITFVGNHSCQFPSRNRPITEFMLNMVQLLVKNNYLAVGTCSILEAQ